MNKILSCPDEMVDPGALARENYIFFSQLEVVDGYQRVKMRMFAYRFFVFWSAALLGSPEP